MTFIRDVADGVHVITRAHTNMYLVENDGRLLFIDAGLPAFWQEVEDAVTKLGHGPETIDGVLLTHAHFDHVGCARRMRDAWGIPVWVHEADQALASHPYSYRHEKSRLAYPLSHPGGLGPLVSMAAAGALAVRGTRSDVLRAETAVPGDPALIDTPGHTDGHIAIHYPQRGVVFTGDALVTFDPYTGRPGPQIVAGAATADSGVALSSLTALENTRAAIVLPGHGGPWWTGVDSAVHGAKRRGAH
jgi:glyoxylase-like metal-dependent hydrolase (beta-lactamase superfamily II)